MSCDLLTLTTHVIQDVHDFVLSCKEIKVFIF